MALGPVYEPNLLYSADFLDLQKNILQPFEKHSSILRKHSRRQGMQRHFGVILKSLWRHFGINFGSFWDHFGVTLGSLWDHFWITLESFWTQFFFDRGRLKK